MPKSRSAAQTRHGITLIGLVVLVTTLSLHFGTSVFLTAGLEAMVTAYAFAGFLCLAGLAMLVANKYWPTPSKKSLGTSSASAARPVRSRKFSRRSRYRSFRVLNRGASAPSLVSDPKNIPNSNSDKNEEEKEPEVIALSVIPRDLSSKTPSNQKGDKGARGGAEKPKQAEKTEIESISSYSELWTHFVDTLPSSRELISPTLIGLFVGLYINTVFDTECDCSLMHCQP